MIRKSFSSKTLNANIEIWFSPDNNKCVRYKENTYFFINTKLVSVYKTFINEYGNVVIRDNLSNKEPDIELLSEDCVALNMLYEKIIYETDAERGYKILEKKTINGGEGSIIYAIVEFPNGLKFEFKNIFDFGNIISPMYNIEGNNSNSALMDSNGKWITLDSNFIKEYTEEEKKCIAILYNNPPIRTHIRL